MASKAKFAPPKHPLLVEKTLKKITPIDSHKDLLTEAFFKSKFNETADVHEKAAWAKKLVDFEASSLSSKIDTSFKNDFRAWLCGNSPFNNDTRITPWGDKPLFFMNKGVREFLAAEHDMHHDFRAGLVKLQYAGPGTTLEQAYLYYKYIVRALHWYYRNKSTKPGDPDPYPPWYDHNGQVEFLDMYALLQDPNADTGTDDEAGQVRKGDDNQQYNYKRELEDILNKHHRITERVTTTLANITPRRAPSQKPVASRPQPIPIVQPRTAKPPASTPSQTAPVTTESLQISEPTEPDYINAMDIENAIHQTPSTTLTDEQKQEILEFVDEQVFATDGSLVNLYKQLGATNGINWVINGIMSKKKYDDQTVKIIRDHLNTRLLNILQQQNEAHKKKDRELRDALKNIKQFKRKPKPEPEIETEDEVEAEPEPETETEDEVEAEPEPETDPEATDTTDTEPVVTNVSSPVLKGLVLYGEAVKKIQVIDNIQVSTKLRAFNIRKELFTSTDVNTATVKFHDALQALKVRYETKMNKYTALLNSEPFKQSDFNTKEEFIKYRDRYRAKITAKMKKAQEKYEAMYTEENTLFAEAIIQVNNIKAENEKQMLLEQMAKQQQYEAFQREIEKQKADEEARIRDEQQRIQQQQIADRAAALDNTIQQQNQEIVALRQDRTQADELLQTKLNDILIAQGVMGMQQQEQSALLLNFFGEKTATLEQQVQYLQAYTEWHAMETQRTTQALLENSERTIMLQETTLRVMYEMWRRYQVAVDQERFYQQAPLGVQQRYLLEQGTTAYDEKAIVESTKYVSQLHQLRLKYLYELSESVKNDLGQPNSMQIPIIDTGIGQLLNLILFNITLAYADDDEVGFQAHTQTLRQFFDVNIAAMESQADRDQLIAIREAFMRQLHNISVITSKPLWVASDDTQLKKGPANPDIILQTEPTTSETLILFKRPPKISDTSLVVDDSEQLTFTAEEILLIPKNQIPAQQRLYELLQKTNVVQSIEELPSFNLPNDLPIEANIENVSMIEAGDIFKDTEGNHTLTILMRIGKLPARWLIPLNSIVYLNSPDQDIPGAYRTLINYEILNRNPDNIAQLIATVAPPEDIQREAEIFQRSQLWLNKAKNAMKAAMGEILDRGLNLDPITAISIYFPTVAPDAAILRAATASSAAYNRGGYVMLMNSVIEAGITNPDVYSAIIAAAALDAYIQNISLLEYKGLLVQLRDARIDNRRLSELLRLHGEVD